MRKTCKAHNPGKAKPRKAMKKKVRTKKSK